MPVRCTSIVKPPEGRVAVVRRLDALDPVRYSRLIENARDDTLVVRRQGETTPLLHVDASRRGVGLGCEPSSRGFCDIAYNGNSLSQALNVEYVCSSSPTTNPNGAMFSVSTAIVPSAAITYAGAVCGAAISGGDGGFAQTVYGGRFSATLVNLMKTWTAGRTHDLYGGYFAASVSNYAGSIPASVNAYSGYFAEPSGSISGTYTKRAAYFAGDIELANGKNLHVATSTGSKLGTAAGQKLGFWGVTPVTQRAANADTSGASLGALETEVNEIKQALRDVGIIAT